MFTCRSSAASSDKPMLKEARRLSIHPSIYLSICICIYTYTHIDVSIYTSLYIYIYIYIYIAIPTFSPRVNPCI